MHQEELKQNFLHSCLGINHSHFSGLNYKVWEMHQESVLKGNASLQKTTPNTESNQTIKNPQKPHKNPGKSSFKNHWVPVLSCYSSIISLHVSPVRIVAVCPWQCLKSFQSVVCPFYLKKMHREAFYICFTCTSRVVRRSPF